MSFLRSLSLRKQGVGIRRYAARLKSGSRVFARNDIYTRILILLKIYVELMLNRVVEGEEVRAFVELPEKAKVLMPITRKRLRDQEKSWRLPRKAPGLDLYTFYFK